MGTRADFYLGRGPQAEWLGSIAWDGYPEGNPRVLLNFTDLEAYKIAVSRLTNEGTKPEQGWPWPWNDSHTTDYAYAFDEGRVWASCFGHGWWPADQQPEDECAGQKTCVFPNMEHLKNVAWDSKRSGFIVIE